MVSIPYKMKSKSLKFEVPKVEERAFSAINYN